MKIALYRKGEEEPFRMCYDPNLVEVYKSGTVKLIEAKETYKIIREEIKEVWKNDKKHILKKIWVSNI